MVSGDVKYDGSCPRCGGALVRRTRRAGLVERVISIVYVYPYRCDQCFTRFRAMRWGKRYYRRLPA